LNKAFSTIAVLIVGCAAMGCTQATQLGMPSYAQLNPSPPDETVERIPVADGWQRNEALVRTTTRYGGQIVKREGTSPNGVSYALTSDWRVYYGLKSESDQYSVDQYLWTSSCKTDNIDDKVTCSMQNLKANIYITLNRQGHVAWVCLIGHDFPGKTGAIRVDDRRAVATNTDGCVRGRSLEHQFRSGKQVTTRRVEWPYQQNIDRVETLTGFTEALDLARFLQRNYLKLSFEVG